MFPSSRLKQIRYTDRQYIDAVPHRESVVVSIEGRLDCLTKCPTDSATNKVETLARSTWLEPHFSPRLDQIPVSAAIEVHGLIESHIMAEHPIDLLEKKVKDIEKRVNF